METVWARNKTEVSVTFNDLSLIEFLETEVAVKEMADSDSFTGSASKKHEFHQVSDRKPSNKYVYSITYQSFVEMHFPW